MGVTKKETVAEYNARYYHEHKDDILENKKNYHKKNKDILNKRCSDYGKSSAGKENRRRYKKVNAIKVSAQNEVNKAIQKGDIKRAACENCGNEKSEAHHDDYALPLSVRFLCKKHHNEWHKINGAGINGNKTK